MAAIINTHPNPYINDYKEIEPPQTNILQSAKATPESTVQSLTDSLAAEQARLLALALALAPDLQKNPLIQLNIKTTSENMALLQKLMYLLHNCNTKIQSDQARHAENQLQIDNLIKQCQALSDNQHKIDGFPQELKPIEARFQLTQTLQNKNQAATEELIRNRTKAITEIHGVLQLINKELTNIKSTNDLAILKIQDQARRNQSCCIIC